MAGRLIVIDTEITEVSLVAATVKTVIEAVAASNHGVLLHAVGISFDSILPTDEPVEVTLAVKSVAATASAVTERDYDEDKSATIQTVGTVNATAEGTITYDFFPRLIHPQGGWEIWYPPGKPLPIIAGGILGLRCNAPQAQDCHAFFLIEE